MTATTLRELNDLRTGRYLKDASEEAFLQNMNEVLQQHEVGMYEDHEIEHPFVFVHGLPRSGTTLISQLLAHGLDCGYIDNVAAKFWLAPLHGLRLSRSLGGRSGDAISFSSDYARTTGLFDIHEFGYFWRHWLRKESMDDVVHVKEREGDIDWPAVRRVLSSMQHEVGKPMVFKNIFGSYHQARMRDVLGKALYVYVERDPLDVAISILDARRKYYGSDDVWWSYTPPEYNQLAGLDGWQQIAGQVHFLKEMYERQAEEVGQEYVIRVQYADMCASPRAVLERVVDAAEELFGTRMAHGSEAPASFPVRTYDDRAEDKRRFAGLLSQFAPQHA